MIFGIENKTHAVKGTSFNPAKVKGKGNQNLKDMVFGRLCKPNVGFDIFPLNTRANRIVMFAVNAAVDKPVGFCGRAYVRIGTSKTELEASGKGK